MWFSTVGNDDVISTVELALRPDGSAGISDITHDEIVSSFIDTPRSSGGQIVAINYIESRMSDGEVYREVLGGVFGTVIIPWEAEAQVNVHPFSDSTIFEHFETNYGWIDALADDFDAEDSHYETFSYELAIFGNTAEDNNDGVVEDKPVTIDNDAVVETKPIDTDNDAVVKDKPFNTVGSQASSAFRFGADRSSLVWIAASTTLALVSAIVVAAN